MRKSRGEVNGKKKPPSAPGTAEGGFLCGVGGREPVHHRGHDDAKWCMGPPATTPKASIAYKPAPWDQGPTGPVRDIADSEVGTP